MKSESGRLFPALLLVLAAALCLLNLSGRDLWEPNEPIAAEAAREMALRGDWLLPTVNGETYPDKPPLLFWGIRLASLPAGKVTETSARIPSALAGVCLVLAVYFLSRRALGSRGAFLAALSLAVSTFFVEQARYAQHDMLLLLGMSVGTLALFRIADAGDPAGGWIILAALALGFGVLSKGPVALALPALVIGIDTFFERRVFRRWGWLILAGLLALLPPLIYYLALVRTHGPELLEGFLFRHNVNRFVEGFDHFHPWWFFLARTPVDLLPVSLFVPAAFFFRPEEPEQRRLLRRMVVWILVPLVFFTFSASKRPVYLLPALPAAAILCGAVVEAAARGRLRGAARRLLLAAEGSALALMGLAGVAAPFLAMKKAPEMLPVSYLLAACALAGSAAGLIRLARGRILAAHGSLAGALALIWLVAIFRVYPVANDRNSPRPFAETLLREVPAESPLKTYGLYRFRSGYIFYTGRLMPRLPDVPALEGYLGSEERVFCVLPEENYRRLKGTTPGPLHLLASGNAGRRKDCLISNRPGPPASPSTGGSPGTDPASRAPGARSGTGS